MTNINIDKILDNKALTDLMVRVIAGIIVAYITYKILNPTQQAIVQQSTVQ